MLHGVMNIWKEKGFTSHDVVAKLRGILGQRKIGHTGTLDPDAVGVLPVCLGKATKLCDMLTDTDKVYEAILLLGQTTDTQDTSGMILSKASTESLDEEKVLSCISSYIGRYEQVPPMYSAQKINGKKLYELAREGKIVERKAKSVWIHHIEINRMELPRVYITVTCSKGTYIRTLCHDIGHSLGVGGCMEHLIRTKVGSFDQTQSHTLNQIQEAKQLNSLENYIIPIDQMFLNYNSVQVQKEYISFAYNGNPLKLEYLSNEKSFQHKDNEMVRVYDENGQFISIYNYQKETEIFKIVKMFFDQNEMT
ncbi:MAG: tRNA pseudouridine(55) synthase TruB [Lachnospiraceae bacterium]